MEQKDTFFRALSAYHLRERDKAWLKVEEAYNVLCAVFGDEDILNATERHPEILRRPSGDKEMEALNAYFLSLEVYELAEKKYMGYD